MHLVAVNQIVQAALIQSEREKTDIGIMMDFTTQLVSRQWVSLLLVNNSGTLIFHQWHNNNHGDTTLDKNRDNHLAMNNFLSGVERRAFRMAEIATGNPDDALDLVQDAMLSLVKNYSHKTPKDWGPLFHRILQSRIRDWYRRSTVRNKLLDWLGLADKKADGQAEYADPIQTAVDHHGKTPEDMAKNSDAGEALDLALKQLPLRQQQAFLLRNWEGLDVKQTAAAMACSDGSVKTHYSRAVHRLREILEDHYEAGR
jgi:RNA polymerase sigma-70 factor, ECF subfamily